MKKLKINENNNNNNNNKDIDFEDSSSPSDEQREEALSLEAEEKQLNFEFPSLSPREGETKGESLGLNLGEIRDLLLSSSSLITQTETERLDYERKIRNLKNSELLIVAKDFVNALGIPEVRESDLSKENNNDSEDPYENIEHRIEKARDNFFEYVLLMAPLLIPDGFVVGRHIKLICDELQKVYESIPKNNAGLGTLKADRVQLFLPPGGMKSLLASVLFPTWCFGKRPSIRMIGVGHTTSFARDNFGRPCRDLMQTPEYAEIFPNTTIRDDVKAADNWRTDQGGTYIAVGVGNQIAGKRAHISICDDVMSEQTAISVGERTKINAWYIPGLQSRLLPGGAEVIINTRWHLEDLSGSRLKSDGGVYGRDPREDAEAFTKFKRPWRVVSIPAILDETGAKMLNEANPESPPLYPGDSFWPEFQPLEWLLEKKNTGDMTEATWAALYMQTPIAAEGNIFKKKYIQYWEDKTPPTVEYVLVSLDTAFSTTTSADYSAYTVWGVFKTKYVDFRGRELLRWNAICLAGERGRWSFGQLTEKVREIKEKYDPDAYLVERKASGQSLIQEMKLQGFPVFDYLPDRDKKSRAHAVSPYFENGSVWWPQGRDWVMDIIEELLAFDKAPHDDFVDTITQALLWLRDNWFIKAAGNEFDDEDWEPSDDPRYSGSRSTYWSSIIGST